MSNTQEVIRKMMVTTAKVVLENTLKDISESPLMLAYDEKTTKIRVNIYKELLNLYKEDINNIKEIKVVVNWLPDHNYTYHPHVSLKFFDTYKLN